MTRLSVIIPVFNNEDFVEKCLLSVLASSVDDFEVICVDDASTDSSAEIAARIAARDARVRVVRHPRNRGVGAARNTGIAAASGTYLGGVDSDDRVAPDMYEKLLAASAGQADVVECGIAKMTPDGRVLSRWKPARRNITVPGRKLNIFEATKLMFNNKIWKRSLFVDNDIWFPERLYFEDLATTPRILAMAQDVRAVTEGCPYHYTVRPGSITQSASPKHQMDHLACFDILADFLNRQGLMERHREDFHTRVMRSLNYHAKNVASSDMPPEQKLRYMRHTVMLQQGYLNNYVALDGLNEAQLLDVMLNDAPEAPSDGIDRQHARNQQSHAAQADRLRQEIAALGEQADRLRQKAAAAERKSKILRNKLREAQDQNRALTTSTSWKITAPLRKLSSALRRR